MARMRWNAAPGGEEAGTVHWLQSSMREGSYRRKTGWKQLWGGKGANLFFVGIKTASLGREGQGSSDHMTASLEEESPSRRRVKGGQRPRMELSCVCMAEGRWGLDSGHCLANQE